MTSTTEKRTEPYLLFDKAAKRYKMVEPILYPLWRQIVYLSEIKPGDRVLDVCTGTGGVAYLCALKGAEVVGIDMSEAMLGIARSKASHIKNPNAKTPEFFRMDARELEFEDDSFDQAVLSMALHEMWPKERMAVLKNMARTAKKRVVVGDYFIPKGRIKRWITIGVTSFEFLESAGFSSYIAADLAYEFESAGISVEDQAWVRFGFLRAIKGMS